MQDVIDAWKFFLYEHQDDVSAGAGILLFSKSGEVLLSKRGRNVSQPLTIGTIGGHLTKGEPPSMAAKREFYEEAGFAGPFENMSLLYIQNMDNFTYFSFIASTDQVDFDFEPFEEFSNEIVWTKWLDFEEIKNSKELHPGLIELFANEYVVGKIRQFIKNIE